MSNIAKTTLLIFILLIAGGCGKKDQNKTSEADVQAQNAKDEEALRAALTEMISFIEVGDYEGLFKKYTSPEDWHRMDSTNSILRARRRVMMFRDAMIKQFRTALAQKPIFSENNTRATYIFKEDMPELVFTKINGRWYSSE